MFANTVNVISRMRGSDLVDIFIISGLIFFALYVLRRNIHKRVLLVFFVLAVIYLAARTYHWQLTLRFLEVIAFSTSVGFILVFQEDIRRFLETSLFSVFSDASAGSSEAAFKSIVKSVKAFSKNRIGALIVLERKIPVVNLVRGGDTLDGEVSFALLCSLFDPHSLGHDGAVIMRGSRVTHFGVHLPLSRNHGTTGRVGTRHAAALGLSEVTDAFIVVVSEETGDIGIAQNGEFRKVEIHELESILFCLRELQKPPITQRSFMDYLRGTWILKFVSVGIALVLWVAFVAPGAVQQRRLKMSVTMEGPPRDLMLEDPSPSEVVVTLSGPEDDFANWPKDKQIVRVPSGRLTPGDLKIPLSNANLSLPTGIRVIQFEPSHLSLKAYKTRKVKVPVVINTLGRAPASELKYRVRPEEVTLVVREGDPGPNMVVSEPIDLSLRKKGEQLELKYVLPPKTQLAADTPQSVHVDVD